jgi:hypothetical protein
MPRPVLLLTVVPLGLAACGGGGGGSKSPVSRSVSTTVSPAVAKTISLAVAKTGKSAFHIVFAGSVKASVGSGSLRGSGDNEASARRGTMHIVVALGGVEIPLDEILYGKNVYVSSSFFSSFLPHGKKWLQASLASATKTFGSSGFALTSPGTVPSLLAVRQVGTATVGGVQTTEYRGRIDLSKWPASARAALKAGKVTFGPVDVWVGSDGYVHRTRFETSTTSNGTRSQLVLTTTLSKFGEHVSATAPSPSQTVDASKMQIPGLAGGGL